MAEQTLKERIFLGEVDVKPAEDDLRFYSVTTLIGALDKPLKRRQSSRCR